MIVWYAFLLLMAVAELTPILARSLLAQYVTIPALVQSPSFLRKANTIHLVLGASRQPSYPNLQVCGVQFSHVLFTPKWVSLYLVTEFSGRLPRSAVRGLNAVLRSTSHFTQSVYLQSLFFFHDNAFGDTSPIFLASEKKPLSAKHVLKCNSSRQLSNNRTSSEAQHMQVFFWHTLPAPSQRFAQSRLVVPISMTFLILFVPEIVHFQLFI